MACFGQYIRVLITFLKLKSWRFVFMIVTLTAAASNLFFYQAANDWNQSVGDNDMYMIGAKEFQAENILLGDLTKYEAEFQMLAASVTRMSNVNFKENNLERCESNDDCARKYFKLLMGMRPGKYVHYVDFDSSANASKITCQMSSGTELYCPFVAYLVGFSQHRDPLGETIQYDTLTMFRLMSSISAVQHVTTGKDTVCKNDVNYARVLSRTLMVQMVFILLTLVFYLLVSTVSCIYDLKRTGFLQLMFRRRLSVLAYWLALWTITLLEMAIFAAVLTIAHHLQCPGFYTSSRLITTFLSAFLQFCCVAAFTLLITALTRSAVIASVAACLLHVVALAFIVVNRMILREPSKPSFIRYIMLLHPFGLSPDQIYAALNQYDVKIDGVFKLVLPVSGVLFAVLLVVTMYIDSVTEAGNGRCFPIHYIFLSRFWSVSSRDRVEIEASKNSALIEAVSPTFLPKLRTNRLRMSSRTCCGGTNTRLTDFSETFYEDQITAVVGHNGSGKSTLLQILSGEIFATEGQATINKILITDALYRNHLSNDIGYCPQTDALVSGLTVLDNLVLTAASADVPWEDVQQEVISVLTALQIEDKLYDNISSLSDSEKRKVCVTIALVGKPKVILLDFPARDLDYISRRRLWRLLHEYKKGRTVIVSTLFIDEAEGMANRMIFMSGGRVICAGSSFFMKRAFDCRFIIQIASKTEFHIPYITRILTTKFNCVRVRSTDRADLEIEVPLLEDRILPSVALEIEGMSKLIDEFGIANFSLDDVYSKLKPLPSSEVTQHFMSSTIGYTADDVDRIKALKSQPEWLVPEGPAVVKFGTLVPITVFAMLVAHFMQVGRSTERIIARVVVPIFLLLLLVGCGILEKTMKNDEMELVFDLSAVDKLDTSRGTCLYISSSDPHYDSIIDADCAVMLAGSGNVSVRTLHRGIPLSLKEYKPESFVSNVLNKKIFSDIDKSCRKSFSPCPVVYAHNWCPDKMSPVTTHQVYVGAYVSNNNETPISIASANIEVFKHIFRFTSSGHIKYLISKSVPVKRQFFQPSFEVKGVIDLRSIFYPFYGMFIQLVILAVVPSICLSDIIQDKRTGVYRQLVSMSMSRFHYWLSTLLNHWIQLAFLFILTNVALMILVTPGYTNAFYIVGAFIPTLIFGLTNSLLCVYALSTVINDFSYLYVVSYSFFSLTVALSSLIVQTSNTVGQILIYLMPHYAIIAPTFYCTRFTHYSLAYFRDVPEPNLLGYLLSVPHTRDALIALLIHFLLLIVLLVVLENRKTLCKCLYKTSALGTESTHMSFKDESITQELKNIQTNPKNELNIMEANHVQVINSDGKLMVKNLTFGLKHGEIFGLLGPCGAGKSLAVRGIVNDKRLFSGRVDFQVNDRWLSNESAVQLGFIGYCPKYNPLFERLTVRENLVFYARSIGVPLDRVQQLLVHFYLENEANTVVLNATTGVKRRLTLAIAVLPSPHFVAINQASEGVDPEGRKALWQAIKSLASTRRGMLVATQEMEEAESLCGRICILNGGLMVALNDIKQMINRYKRMYFIEIQVSQNFDESPQNVESRKTEIIEVILEKFRGSIVTEQLTLRVQFGVPINSVGTLSKALTWLLEQKNKLKFLYFTIHYATIDQTMKVIVVHNENQMIEKKQMEPNSVSA